MALTFTRRALAGIAAAAALGKREAAAQSPQASALPANPEEELTAVRAQNKANMEQIAKIALPLATEPATHFKA